ncbi:MAG TPA: DUF6194 family protein [Pseudonocardiaceae bacterium]|jgi:hypothetical protein
MDFAHPEGIIAFAADQLPDVIIETADEASGAPEIAWGDTFIFAGPEKQRMPFATIVTKDYPGFDTESQLDRPGVFRLNIGAGKAKFTELLGYPPADHTEHATDFDYTAFDALIPHPAYAIQAWISFVNPGPKTTNLAAELLVATHRRVSGCRD